MIRRGLQSNKYGSCSSGKMWQILRCFFMFVVMPDIFLQ